MPCPQLVELALPMSEAMTTIYHAIAELLGACIKVGSAETWGIHGLDPVSDDSRNARRIQLLNAKFSCVWHDDEVSKYVLHCNP